jgi:hypothetical protein
MDDSSPLGRFAREHIHKLGTESPMARPKGNHTRTEALAKQPARLTQPERALWRAVYIAALSALLRTDYDSSVEATANTCAAHADEAVNQHRSRIVWAAGRSSHE